MRLQLSDRISSYNLSARGLRVNVWMGELDDSGFLGRDITDFPGDTDPITIDAITVGRVERDINGDAYRIGQLPLYSVSLSLIPGSDGDNIMQEWILDEISSKAQDSDKLNTSPSDDGERQWSLKATYPNVGKTTTFSMGYFTGMTPGYAATSEGRVATHLYNFEFSKCTNK